MISIYKLGRLTAIVIITMTLSLLTQSCFTGIEHTGHINLSKKDLDISRKISEEEAFMQDISGVSLQHWQKGREFYVTDERASLAFNNPAEKLEGKVLYYAGNSAKLTPAGTERIYLTFTDDKGNEFSYNTLKDNPDDVISSDLKMLIDMQLVKQLTEKLRGKKLWTRTTAWIDKDGMPLKGRKFEQVEITNVLPGTETAPFNIEIKDKQGNTAYIRMTQNEGNLATRPFHSIFALGNPRKDYPGITDETWENICAGQVATGMNKQECKLALGSPTDADSFRDYTKTIDIWTYSNGIFLRFEDDILVSFKK